MIAAICLILFGGAILLDVYAYRRFVSRCANAPLRMATIAVCAVTDMLPFWVIALSRGLFFFDNTQCFSDVAMWVATLYLIVVPPRMVLYLGLLIARRNAIVRTLAVALSVAAFGLLMVGFVKTRTDLVVRRVNLEYRTLPASFDGYRIAFISDLHIGAMSDASRFCAEIVDTLNSLCPDLVVFGGDLAHIRHSEIDDRIRTILGRIRATDGVVAVLGNHDMGIYIKDTVVLSRQENVGRVCSAMHDMGWQLLRDSTAYIRRGQDSIAVTGIDFSERLLELRYKFAFEEGDCDVSRAYASMPDSLFNITVSHLPQLWQTITAAGYGNLTLAGHIHAGQLKAECGGLSLSPAMLMYREWSGLYGDDEHRLYINDGIGSVGFYIRIGAKPEITLIELQH